MTSRGALASFRRMGFVSFGHLPQPVRMWLIRRAAPSYTLGALAVIEHDGKVLLAREASRSKWGLPGGLVERGESPPDAARREVLEEVGIDVELTGDERIVITTASRQVDATFAAVLARGVTAHDARPTAVEILECAWFKRSALPPLQPITESVLRRWWPDEFVSR